MSLEYYWRHFTKSWRFRFFGRQVNFGLWLNVVTDRVVGEIPTKPRPGDHDKPYLYQALRGLADIRVLELAPGNPGDALKGRLIDNPSVTIQHGEGTSHRWQLKYEALSYVWGSMPNVHMPRILLEEEYYLDIGPSLETALRKLRHVDERRLIWADAISVNQMDLAERSSQVNLMLEVYAQADNVNIWLGPASQDTAFGMEVLRHLSQTTSAARGPWEGTSNPAYVTGIREIVNREWFSRLWVVQEAAVSQKATMMCGDDSFQWTNDPVLVRKFIRRAKFAAISPQWEQAGLSEVNLGRFMQILNLQMDHIRRLRKDVLAEPADILDIAFELRHRKVSDPRDRLFAIMGMVDHKHGSILTPDYSQTVNEVYQRLWDTLKI